MFYLTWHYINANNQYHVPTALILQRKLQVQLRVNPHFDAWRRETCLPAPDSKAEFQ
jgi:hypothetical protein